MGFYIGSSCTDQHALIGSLGYWESICSAQAGGTCPPADLKAFKLIKFNNPVSTKNGDCASLKFTYTGTNANVKKVIDDENKQFSNISFKISGCGGLGGGAIAVRVAGT